ncbi:MAG: hypothetical protein LH702_20065 [Phormidesmis sp. CAN_BIN44]|nr:hypothetical protein [Phormidesmis sp. CAN_BIN44]
MSPTRLSEMVRHAIEVALQNQSNRFLDASKYHHQDFSSGLKLDRHCFEAVKREN